MRYLSRKHFIKTTAGLMGAAWIPLSFEVKGRRPLLSFSTLGCPDWSFQAIVDFATKNGYDGIEIRGIQRELDLTKCPAFRNHENILASRKLAGEKGIRIIALGSSAQLHHAGAAERKRNLDEARGFIDLAHRLTCPYIRVFPNNFPTDQERNAVMDLIVQGLAELGEYAKGSGVSVLMETHGDVVKSDDLLKIMRAAESPHTGLVWDVNNMWSVTKEPPGVVYEKLKKYIRHTHIKDGKIINGQEQYTLVGKGTSPIFEAIEVLYKGGYKGYYSFEWEKMWHP
jgi:sugar phosphate isomerase/epimerase